MFNVIMIVTGIVMFGFVLGMVFYNMKGSKK